VGKGLKVGIGVAFIELLAEPLRMLAVVAELRVQLAEEAKASGKPANIIEKIVDGKMGVFYRDECGVLTEQPFAKDDSKTVRQVLAEAGLKSKAFFLWMLGR
jgi:elongation factor Ts